MYCKFLIYAKVISKRRNDVTSLIIYLSYLSGVSTTTKPPPDCMVMVTGDG